MRMASRHSHAPTNKLIEYELWVSDSNMFHRDTTQLAFLLWVGAWLRRDAIAFWVCISLGAVLP